MNNNNKPYTCNKELEPASGGTHTDILAGGKEFQAERGFIALKVNLGCRTDGTQFSTQIAVKPLVHVPQLRNLCGESAIPETHVMARSHDGPAIPRATSIATSVYRVDKPWRPQGISRS
jgi:hypothetical protein